MFFALHKLKMAKTAYLSSYRERLIKCHLVNLCTFCVVSVAPFSAGLYCEMCIFRYLLLLFSISHDGIKQNNDRCRQLKPSTFMAYSQQFCP